MNARNPVLALLAAMLMLGAAAVASAADYRVALVSHIGSNDPNMERLTLSLREF